jgi:hypothetical protein
MSIKINVLINALGIVDSGGISVLDKLLLECTASDLVKCYVVCNRNSNIDKLIRKFHAFKNFEFKVVSNRGFIYRICYENIIFRRHIKNNIDLIYNFSGSYQCWIKKPQIVKVHNLIFYSKVLDKTYKGSGRYVSWIKEVYLKRFFFKFSLKNAKYIEIQSNHVKDHISNFINIKNKFFYVKSDINVSNNEFHISKQYDFSKKINFLYIVGPHFEYLHKNLLDFTYAMLELNKKKVDFEINITLTKEQLSNSKVWNMSLNSKTNFLGYISDQEKMEELFCDNTILISTSVVETLGLHVIEGIKNGIITIAPDEEYANAVYGENMFKYKLFNKDSLLSTIINIINYQGSFSKNILFLQNNLRQSEKSKFGSILDVFNEVKNVQK